MSAARALARRVVPSSIRASLRRSWHRAELLRRRRQQRRGTLIRRFDIALPPPAPRLHIEARSRLSIPTRLERGGLAAFEPEGIGCILALLERLAKGTFFDVGANIAPYSLVASALTDWTVVAFEPAPPIAAVARHLRDLNGLRFGVEEVALGETEGRFPLYLSKTSDTSNSLKSSWRPWERTVTVPVETLDGYCARTGLDPSVLKLDTETTEPAVLRGAGRLLAEQRPWIVCEVLQGHTEAELEDVLEPLGYHRYHITGGGALEPSDRLAGEAAVFRDWLLAPEPVGAELASRARHWAAALSSCGPIER